MISRDNSNVFSEESFEKLASKINKINNRKLYKVCSTQEDVIESVKAIKLSGYNYEINNCGNKCSVYSIFPDDAIDLSEANKSGQFEKLAWGRYTFQKASAICDFQKYNFDDGTIWKVITGSDGKQYLAKEVEDDDEEKVIRNKTASLNKRASINVDNNNASNICDMLFDTKDNFFKEIMNSDSSQVVIAFLKNYLDKYIDDSLKNNGILDTQRIENAKKVIYDKMNSNSIMNRDSLDKLIMDLK